VISLNFSWRWFVLPLALGAILPLACDDSGRIELVLPPGELPDGGTLADVEVTDGALDGDAQLDDAADSGVSRVLVGVTPNPRGDGPPNIADVIDARLTVMAVGARGVVIRRSPVDLASDEALGQLEAEASTYGKNGIVVNFVFSVVDGSARKLDPAFDGYDWGDSMVIKAMATRIDQILLRLGPTPSYFLFGRDVDIYLAAHPDERPALEAFLGELIGYVRTHVSAPPNLRIGVGFSYAGVTEPDPSWPKLLEASDVAVCSYLPGLGMDAAGSPSNIATDVDVLATKVQGKPIVIEALGYPTSDVVGGSDAKQALFLENFFTVLGPRRSSFEFVNIEGLHDFGPLRCADRALFSGQAVDGPWAAYACSLGLFTPDSQPKAAWQVFVNGAAEFASP
jgi:hypothetical protein